MLSVWREKLSAWNRHFALEDSPSSGARESLQWLMFARLGVLYFVLAIVVANQIFARNTVGRPFYTLAYGILCMSYALNLFFALWVEKMPTGRWSVSFNVIFDCIVTSVWILYGSGKESLFVLLYLVQILAASIILYQKGALFTASVASICYGLVMGISPAAGGWIQWAVYSSLFLMVGFVGGHLSEELLITARSLKEKSQTMERLQRIHEEIIANLPTGLLTVDRDLRVIFVNPAGAHILGRNSIDIVGRSLNDVEPGLLPFFSQIEAVDVLEEESESVGAVMDEETALSVTGTAQHRSVFAHPRAKSEMRLQQRVEIGSSTNSRILRGDVAELEEGTTLGSLDEKGRGGKVLLFQDVTKLLNLEERLRQNEKLAAVGQLAAGIAHEIRNPLASMSASIEMLKDSIPVDTGLIENRKLMEIAIREIDRLNRLVSEFLDFVKPEKLRLESVDLSVLLTELVLTAKRAPEFRDRLQIVENYQPKLMAHANFAKLKQVAWNLLMNAMQAMTGSGRIEVGCTNVNERRVKFWVEDEGCGMGEDILSHLYEPFFTTKDRGTGLGLATAYKIIEAHHGEIRVHSVPGKGTRFEIYLPSA